MQFDRLLKWVVFAAYIACKSFALLVWVGRSGDLDPFGSFGLLADPQRVEAVRGWSVRSWLYGATLERSTPGTGHPYKLSGVPALPGSQDQQNRPRTAKTATQRPTAPRDNTRATTTATAAKTTATAIQLVSFSILEKGLKIGTRSQDQPRPGKYAVSGIY